VATVLAHFVALRQEVNLQTRAVRTQQEQNVEALLTLQQALEALERVRQEARAADQQAEEVLLRPLLATLVGLHDALSLAGREIQRVQASVLPGLGEVLAAGEVEEPTAPPVPGPFWARWFGSPPSDADLRAAEARKQRQQQARQAGAAIQQALGALVTGYSMSLQRVERALRQHGLEPIPAAGQPFDPEQMEVLEVVAGTGRAAGEVVEEVRRGYLWNGRVFCFAQVRVAQDIPSEEQP
jgi:molecular chaperone GrpE